MFDFLKKKLAVFRKKEEEKLDQKIELPEGMLEAKVPSASEQLPAAIILGEQPAAVEPLSGEPAPIAEKVETPELEGKPSLLGKLFGKKPKLAELEKPAKELKPVELELLEEHKPREGHRPAAQEKVFEAKLTLGTRVRKAVLRRAQIAEADVRPLLEDFNLELVEADVASSVADEICDTIRDRLVGREVGSKQDVRKVTEGAIKEALLEVLKQDRVDFVERVRSKKPFVIMFLGPNGHGKSTTISKVAHLLKKNHLRVVLAAADTFRAASIEQLEELGKRSGAGVIKHKYGADPAAVCFDAIRHAESHGLDAVLIDTAGRSDLNINLMEQLKKIARVAKPDMKIYVGEALAGNAAVEEARRFHEAVGLDGIIMSKADCDVKGGSLLSIAHVIKKPILFIGTGQGVDDLQEFSEEWFVKKVFEE